MAEHSDSGQPAPQGDAALLAHVKANASGGQTEAAEGGASTTQPSTPVALTPDTAQRIEAVRVEEERARHALQQQRQALDLERQQLEAARQQFQAAQGAQPSISTGPRWTPEEVRAKLLRNPVGFARQVGLGTEYFEPLSRSLYYSSPAAAEQTDPAAQQMAAQALANLELRDEVAEIRRWREEFLADRDEKQRQAKQQAEEQHLVTQFLSDLDAAMGEISPLAGLRQSPLWNQAVGGAVQEMVTRGLAVTAEGVRDELQRQFASLLPAGAGATNPQTASTATSPGPENTVAKTPKNKGQPMSLPGDYEYDGDDDKLLSLIKSQQHS